MVGSFIQALEFGHKPTAAAEEAEPTSFTVPKRDPMVNRIKKNMKQPKKQRPVTVARLNKRNLDEICGGTTTYENKVQKAIDNLKAKQVKQSTQKWVQMHESDLRPIYADQFTKPFRKTWLRLNDVHATTKSALK